VNVYFHTFGCKANQYDTDVVRQAFADRGAVVVDDPAAADLAVVNSCTVTHESEVKLRRFVRAVSRGSGAETIVMGCAAALDDGAIAALPSVRAVVANADPTMVLRAAGMSSPAAVGAQHAAPLHRQGKHRGLLKIQDGCDEHCTFCATTLARGANRSRGVAELVEEARALAEHHAEIVLTGVHIGTYGQDRALGVGRGASLETPYAPRPTPSLGQLLEALVVAVPQVRFRLSSVEATEVDDTLAHLLIEAPRHVAAHLHAPLQSGSNRVLKRMGRHWYTAESYRARIEWLAERLPAFGLGADVIAGFPGETEDDHHASLTLLHALPFTYLHVFPFSVRPDAPAARLPDALTPVVINTRARELRALGEAKARAYRAARVGQQADGVVSGRAGGQVDVLTGDYLSVYLPTDRWDGRPRFDLIVD
jgi:threonylcarbamoyladenosine tRNA methylthiotransferase MtaB